MNRRTYVVAIVMLSLLAGCGGAAPAQPTAQPTPTAVQFALSCEIDTLTYGFSITGETGAVESTLNNESTSYNYDASGQMTGATVNVNRDLFYASSQHKYHLEGTITVSQQTNEVTYDITATGDAFGGSPQTCKKP